MKECSTCGRCLADNHTLCPDDGTRVIEVFGGEPTLDGKYALIRRIGGGGMGTVYKARHLALERLCAVKVLRALHPDNDHSLRRFRREATILGRLDHPNIVQVTDFGVDGARRIPYLVMEYVQGVPLFEYIRDQGSLSPEAAVTIFRQVASAVDYAHQEGVLHRDLKLSNVLLWDGGQEKAAIKVLDFGLARVFFDSEIASRVGTEGEAADSPNDEGLDAQTTQSRAPVGTRAYMAPELFTENRYSRASDIYAMGVLIYTTLVGRRPLEGPASHAAQRQLGQEPPVPSEVHPVLAPELDEAIRAPLARDPSLRPRSARAVVGALEAGLLRFRRRRWMERELPRRCAIALLVALLVPALVVGLAESGTTLENKLVDARFYFAPPRPPQPLLVLLLIDEATLEADPTPLADKADEVGRLLQQVLDAGALGVGVDILLPEAWGGSAAFSDLVLRHSDSLVLAAYSNPEGTVIGPEAIEGLTAAALGPKPTERLFGFVNVLEDADGTVRRARPSYQNITGGSPLSFASRAASIVGLDRPAPLREPFWIDFTLDWKQLDQISWKELPQVLEKERHRLAGRFVLLGGDFAASGEGTFDVPHPRALPVQISGTTIQALTILTLVDGLPVQASGRLVPSIASGVLSGMCIGMLLVSSRLAPALWLASLVTTGWMAAALIIFVQSRTLLLTAAPLLVLMATLAVGALIRRRLSVAPIQDG